MFKTVISEESLEIVIEKSRFIAHVFPIKSESEAVSIIEGIKKTHWKATHNVPVYLIGEKHQLQRYSDDGEPSGTAGLPILEMLKHESYSDLGIVVTRYFGGVKLGTGGLVRAYTESAKSVLGASKVVEVQYYDCICATIDYNLQGKVLHLLSNYPTKGLDQAYADAITIKFYVEVDLGPELRRQMIDITSGRIEINEESILYGYVWDNDFFLYNT